MTVWAIADLHLSFSVPEKNMGVFGPQWDNYAEKMEKQWRALIGPDDLVLIPGDISWAMHLEEALIDLKWIDSLPGTKVIIKGNHDYWWSSGTKMRAAMPPSIHFLQNDVFNWKNVSIGGARLWDTPEYGFGSFIEFQENKRAKEKKEDTGEAEKIFVRDLERLRMSLKQLDPDAKWRIALTHYPPIGADLKPSRASAILEEFKIQICLFGHLHNVRNGALPFGEARGVRYHLTSCDYLNFTPLKIID